MPAHPPSPRQEVQCLALDLGPVSHEGVSIVVEHHQFADSARCGYELRELAYLLRGRHRVERAVEDEDRPLDPGRMGEHGLLFECLAALLRVLGQRAIPVQRMGDDVDRGTGAHRAGKGRRWIRQRQQAQVAAVAVAEQCQQAQVAAVAVAEQCQRPAAAEPTLPLDPGSYDILRVGDTVAPGVRSPDALSVAGRPAVGDAHHFAAAQRPVAVPMSPLDRALRPVRCGHIARRARLALRG